MYMRLLPSYLAGFSLFREEGEQASLLVGKQVGGERRGGLHRRVRLDKAKREGGGSRLDQNKLLTSSGSWSGAVRQLASRWGRVHRQEKSGLLHLWGSLSHHQLLVLWGWPGLGWCLNKMLKPG